MTGRQQPALGEPAEDLTGFPVTRLAGEWYRAHTAGSGPWWFSHDGHGRFDLPPPHGTCCLASHVEGAVRERLGERLVRQGMMTAVDADRMVVSRLGPTPTTVADTTAQGAVAYGLTREISTITPYDRPQQSARALHAAGHGGLRYWPRFSLDEVIRAVALFGSAGHDGSRAVDDEPMSGRDAAADAGIVVLCAPRELPTVDPGPGASPPVRWQ